MEQVPTVLLFNGKIIRFHIGHICMYTTNPHHQQHQPAPMAALCSRSADQSKLQRLLGYARAWAGQRAPLGRPTLPVNEPERSVNEVTTFTEWKVIQLRRQARLHLLSTSASVSCLRIYLTNQLKKKISSGVRTAFCSASCSAILHRARCLHPNPLENI